MKVHVDRDSLQKAILAAESVISAKNINTVLSLCLFNVFKDTMEIVATDNEIAVRTTIDVVSDSEFSFTANGKKFGSILRELPQDEVILSVDDSLMVTITSSSDHIQGHFSLIGASSDEYPEIQSFKEVSAIEVDQQLMKDMFKKVTYAATNDTIKPVFNGVYVVPDTNGYISFVATDSRRLSVITRQFDSELNISEGIIIPLKTVNEVMKQLGNGVRAVFSVNENQCFFKIGSTEIISRIVDGQFPNYRQVIPKETISKAEVSVKKFIESLRRVIIFTREPSYKVLLTFDKDILHIETNTPELGEASEKISLANDIDEKITMGINAHFLLDALKEIDTDQVVIGITGQMSPLTIAPENDSNYISIIMPIQIKN